MNWFRASRLFINKTALVIATVIGVLVVFMTIVRAVDVPAPGNSAFIQTSGPNTLVNIGDYYTSFQGEQGSHFVRALVPCTWPAGLPVTFALYDPEIEEPNPVVGVDPAPAVDEIRDPGNNITSPPNIGFSSITTFTLTAPGGAIVGPVAFTPGGGSNALWVELVTFSPSTPGFGCGVFVVETTTQDNDDNAWILRVNQDPDCSVSATAPGTCSGIGVAQSNLLDNMNQTDNADGTPGTGDEIIISLDRISYQHEFSNTCQTFYYVVPQQRVGQFISLRNFDLDVDRADPNATVTHITASGRVINGTPSLNQAWNNAPVPPPYPQGRGDGDLIQVQPADVGLWQTEICVATRNQYIFEGIEDEVVFLQPPPVPVMVLDKDDGRDLVLQGEVLTYRITFANISDTNPFPLPPPANAAPPGAAFNVVLRDNLPPETTFVSCVINPPFTGTCIQDSPGFVQATLNEPVAAGAGGSVDITYQVNPDNPGDQTIINTVSLNFRGLLGNNFPPLQAEDINFIPEFNDDDDDGDPAPEPTSPPPPPPTRVPQPTLPPAPTVPPPPQEGPVAQVQPQPTPTGPVLYLPETGNLESQQAETENLPVSFIILLAAVIGVIAFLAYNFGYASRKKRDA